jgi:hypothetical protein
MHYNIEFLITRPFSDIKKRKDIFLDFFFLTNHVFLHMPQHDQQILLLLLFSMYVSHIKNMEISKVAMYVNHIYIYHRNTGTSTKQN